MFKRIARSLALTLSVAGVCAWPLTYLGVGFISSFFFFIAAQFVGFYFYSEFIKRKLLREEREFILAQEAELSKQGAEVICPCDRNVKCFVPIILNEYNTYNCPGCKKDIHVMVNYKTALVTTPVVEDPEAVIKQSLKG